jgi:hypothetical protein
VSGEEGPSFFQYAYRPREFESLLADAGFSVVNRQGYAILHGLYELTFVRRLVEGWLERRRRRAKPLQSRMNVQEESGQGEPSPGLLKRVLVAEDDSVPVVGVFLRILRWACANMMMYVCIRECVKSK